MAAAGISFGLSLALIWRSHSALQQRPPALATGQRGEQTAVRHQGQRNLDHEVSILIRLGEGACASEQAGDFGPGIGFAHVDNPNCLDARRRWFDGPRAFPPPPLENDHGNMNLASNTASVSSTLPSRVDCSLRDEHTVERIPM
jgi:hypothetical protein